MHLSKALQPALHVPLGLRKLSVGRKCKGKTPKSMLFSIRILLWKCLFMQYHYSPLKEDENVPGTERLEFQVEWCRRYRVFAKSVLWERETARSLRKERDNEPVFPSSKPDLSAASSMWGFLCQSVKLLVSPGSAPLDESVFNWCVL